MISLPKASDTVRAEAKFIREAAEHVSQMLATVEEALKDGQTRIRSAQHLVQNLALSGAINNRTANAILSKLLGIDDKKLTFVSMCSQCGGKGWYMEETIGSGGYFHKVACNCEAGLLLEVQKQ